MFCKKRHKQRLWAHATYMSVATITIIRVIWFYFFFLFMDVIDQVREVNERNLNTLGQWKSYDHSCSDEYSTFNVPDRLANQETIADKISDSEAFLWVVTVLFICELIPVLCWALYNCIKSHNQRKR